MTEYTFLAKNGLHVTFRPLHEGDAPHLIDIFEHLGAESRYLRFHEPIIAPDPRYVQEQAQAILQATTRQGRGWLAFADMPDAPDTPVGGARYVFVSEDTAEVALTVRDDVQGLGIGSELLRILVDDARNRGVRKLTAVLQATNRAVLNLIRDAPFPISRTREGAEIFIEADLASLGDAPVRPPP